MEAIKLKKVKNIPKTAQSPTVHAEPVQAPLKNKLGLKARLMKSSPRFSVWQSPPMSPDCGLPRCRQSIDTRSQTARMPGMPGDVNAPHLKYGLFLNKAASANAYCRAHKRNDSSVNRSASVVQRTEHTACVQPPIRYSPPSKRNKKYNKPTKQEKIRSKNGRLGISPVMAYQPSGKNMVHKLSLSKMMHLDIKPRQTRSTNIFPSSLRMFMSPSARV